MARNNVVRLTDDEVSFIKQYRQAKAIAYKKEYVEDGLQLNITSNIAQSEEDIIKEYNIDMTIWECVQFKPGGWTTPVKTKFSFSKEKDGKMVEEARATIPVIVENRKSEAVFKKKIDIIKHEEFRKDLLKDLKEKSPIVKSFNYIKTTSNDNRNASAINIFDLHLGLSIWAPETGGQSWDLKIAEKDYDAAFDDLLQKSIKAVGGEKYIDEIMIPVGNDMNNSDTAYPYAMTTKGTPQQEDSRWQKIFRKEHEMLRRNIEKCALIAPVKIKVIPGNHDFQKSFYIGEVLEGFYHNNENVVIDNGPKPQKYWVYGRTLIGLTHGSPHKEGRRLDQLMQFEVPEYWAQTNFREWWLGDIHHKKTITIVDEDKQALYFRHLRTLMPSSSWENEQGYKSIKGAEAFIINFEQGPIFEVKHNKIVEQRKMII